MRPIITSRKHIVQFTLETVAMGGIANKTIAVAQQDAVQSTSVAVEVGATIKAVYVELWATSDGTQQSTSVCTVLKRPNGANSMSFAESQDLHNYANKNNIFLTSQGLFPDNSENPRIVYKGWIKIPKGKQRMSLGDILAFTLNGATDGINFCGIAIFKSYT